MRCRRLWIENLAQVAQSEEVVSPRAQSIAYEGGAGDVTPIVRHFDGTDEGLVYVNAGAPPSVRNFFEQVIPWGGQL